MALTLEADQRLASVGLASFYEEDATAWSNTSRRTFLFVKQNFPPGSPIRRDDVAKALIPILEVHEKFREKLNSDKLRGKFWVSDFADLIVDRCWEQITT